LAACLLKPDATPKATTDRFLPEADAAAKALGVRHRVFEASGPQDFDRVFSEMTAAGANGLIVQATASFEAGGAKDRLVGLASAHRLPALHSFKSFVETGGLISYGSDFADLHRRSAGYVDRILKGAKPADLPVEQPIKFELAINLKTARELGLTIPQLLLLRADEIIEWRIKRRFLDPPRSANRRRASSHGRFGAT
jgi:putative ABC transport system substrate-binding protein